MVIKSALVFILLCVLIVGSAFGATTDSPAAADTRPKRDPVFGDPGVQHHHVRTRPFRSAAAWARETGRHPDLATAGAGGR